MLIILTEDEKITLAMILREKIEETHAVELGIRAERANVTVKSSQLIYDTAIKNVREVREDCYSIAVKLKLK